MGGHAPRWCRLLRPGGAHAGLRAAPAGRAAGPPPGWGRLLRPGRAPPVLRAAPAVRGGSADNCVGATVLALVRRALAQPASRRRNGRPPSPYGGSDRVLA